MVRTRGSDKKAVDEGLPAKKMKLKEQRIKIEMSENRLDPRESMSSLDCLIHENKVHENKEEVSLNEIREKNLRDNAAFLAQLGMFQDKQFLKSMQPKTTTKGLQPKREKRPQVPTERRCSLRLQSKEPAGGEVPASTDSYVPYEPKDSHPRKPSGSLEIMDNIFWKSDRSTAKSVIDIFNRVSSKNIPSSQKKLTSMESFIKTASSMSLSEEGIAKVVQDRIFSVALHPSEEKLLAAAGDKWGRLGLWDVNSVGGHDGVVCIEPHSRPVSCLQFNKQHPHRLYSCSYDGTIRYTDFTTNLFEEVYANDENEEIRITAFDFTSPETLVASQSDGSVIAVDTRTPCDIKVGNHQCHQKPVKCVHVHPLEKSFIVTASNDGSVKLWDLRKMTKKPIECFQHSKSVDSAYFSPITGNSILSTSVDDTIRITSKDGSSYMQKNIRHNNHTGRWLSNFKAVWNPSREDAFVVGSMNYPRQIELYAIPDGKPTLAHRFKSEPLQSVCSLNAFHPTLNVLIGGNSSGKMYAFQ